MEMKGVTREEAVLFLLSLQEQIDLIVQHSPKEYQAIAAQQKGNYTFLFLAFTHLSVIQSTVCRLWKLSFGTF